MRIEQYNPSDMQVIANDITGVDFGEVVKGNHAPNVIAIRPILEIGDTFTSLSVFLEDNGALDHTQFGKFKSTTAIADITAGSDYLSDYFIEEEGISDASQVPGASGDGFILDEGTPEYLWIDAGVGENEVTFGDLSVNFRFIFEYA